MSDSTDHQPKITEESIGTLVREFGQPLDPDRKAALLSTLNNQQALFLRRAMNSNRKISEQDRDDFEIGRS